MPSKNETIKRRNDTNLRAYRSKKSFLGQGVNVSENYAIRTAVIRTTIESYKPQP